MPDARLTREGRIESRHSIKSFEGMESRSHDFGAEIRMHSFTVHCDTFSNEKKVAIVTVTSDDDDDHQTCQTGLRIIVVIGICETQCHTVRKYVKI